MKNNKFFLAVLLGVTLLTGSCTETTVSDNATTPQESKDTLSFEQQLISEVQIAHGSPLLANQVINFKSRGIVYYASPAQYPKIWKRKFIDSANNEVKDIWDNERLQREVNGAFIEISQEKEKAYQNSINSVFYFALLPLALSDPAVNAKALSEVNINEEPYYKIQVTFSENGGGEDFEDIYVYWFHKEKKTMDFFAYKYFTEGGGMRFREAINRRTVDGIVFQDYKNYKPKTEGISVFELDKAFQKNQLEIVSTVTLENINLSEIKEAE